ncbi:hypothetical protein [Streptomyces chartreusis]|uniref:hypothetical protein n=1 Tax=Streptomyces chartreusis TaxID=1969 RepID=UPI0038130175
MSTPYERLMQEAIPTRPPAKPPHEPWTPEEQAQHVADLLEALADWKSPDPRDIRKRERHLRIVPTDQSHTDAA